MKRTGKNSKLTTPKISRRPSPACHCRAKRLDAEARERSERWCMKVSNWNENSFKFEAKLCCDGDMTSNLVVTKGQVVAS
jgi:hypothetical protein